MTFVFILNIVCYLSVLFAKLFYLSKFFGKKDNLLNPFVLVFLAQLPVDLFKMVVGPAILLDQGIGDKYYNIAIFFTTLSLFCDYLLMRLVFLISSRYKLVIPTFDFAVSEIRMKVSAFVFFLLFVISFLLLSSSSFGVINWILDPRTGYQLHRMGAGQFWLFSISFLSISFALTCLFTRKYSNLFLMLLLFVSFAYLLGSKGIILEYFIFFLIILWIRKFRYLRLFFFAGIPLALSLMLFNFFSSAGANADLTDAFSYFDYYVNSAMYYKAYYSNEIDLFKGEILVTDFWNLIPRGLFPNKPYVYGITHVNEHFFPGAAEATNTPAFGGPINYFADFGTIGVVLCSLFNPFKFIYYFFLCQLLKNYNFYLITHNSIILLLFIFFTAPFFLFSLSFPINIFFFFFLSAILLFLNRIKLPA
jgi:hypothetical protein